MKKLKDYGIQKWDNKIPDKKIFDFMLQIAENQIIFGGNYFTHNLPVSKCWLVWDKGIPKGFTKAQVELMWTSFKTYSRIYKVLWNGMIRVEKSITREHPTQKPEILLKSILLDFSKKNDLILDCFLGSGTTAIACEKLNRRWIGIEISEKYCEIARKRIKSESGNPKYIPEQKLNLFE